jgi:magnesium transporter
MHTILVRRDRDVGVAQAVDPAWLRDDAPEILWVDVSKPDDRDRDLLQNVFHLHELAIEDAFAEIHHPKVEAFNGVLYLILHGIVTEEGATGFVTQDVDFFVGRNFLVTVHHARSRSIEAETAVCLRHAGILADGPVSLLHRIVDQMVDHYGPDVDAIEERLEAIETDIFESERNPMRDLLGLKRDIALLRRVTLPQRDVHDHLVRLADEALFLQDRVTGLLDAHLSNQSNRLNRVMKVLTIIATIFMPLTVLTGAYGMNLTLPHLPGGEAAQFWWIVGMMGGTSGLMLWFFRRMRWL